MSEKEKNTEDAAVEPPVDQPGGGDSALSLEDRSDLEAAVDEPVNQPGGGQKAG
jgi:hypothetical protein